MKSIVFYHANCADGFGAAFAAWCALGGAATYHPMKHEPDYIGLTDMCKGKDVYILDFSFPKANMDLLIEHAAKVVWLDHHKTAFEMWGTTSELYTAQDDKRYICLDNNRSGALIAWEYFHPASAVPLAIQHIDDYDRWQFKIQGTKEFNKGLWSHTPWSFEQWSKLFQPEQVTELYLAGEGILRAHNQNVAATVIGGGRECTLSYNDRGPTVVTGLMANCPAHLSSDVGHELANVSGTFGLLWYVGQGDLVKCSLRSNGDYDVSAIAKQFGGGGHKNTAGFETSLSYITKWMGI
jgi:oligoribonuclease NrnB/cAMP/cGMP phosphodiesterase (DHH superfamily)